MTRILLTGADGQLGQALRSRPARKIKLLACNRARLDITDPGQVNAIIGRFQPSWIINTAAYTAVDKAESDPQRAWAVNRDGVTHLAEAANHYQARLFHISTDFVFDGAQTRPYTPTDMPRPLNVYGQSKRAGEDIARDITAEQAIVLRTAWVYSPIGHNFLTTMMRLMPTRDRLKVVADQKGTPTATVDLARAIWALIAADAPGGLYHYTNAGEATWYEFACEIRRLLLKSRPGQRLAVLEPTDASGFPTPAKRPAFSVLDCSHTELITGRRRHWRQALKATLTPPGNI